MDKRIIVSVVFITDSINSKFIDFDGFLLLNGQFYLLIALIFVLWITKIIR